MGKKIISALALLCLMLASCACAQEAAELTAQCAMRDTKGGAISCLSDGNYKTRWASQSGSGLTITAPEGEVIGGLYVQFYHTVCAFEVQVRGEDGAWQTVASGNEDYLCQYVTLPQGAAQVRLRPAPGAGRLTLAQLHVFAPGDAPGWVQQWKPPLEKADLLVLCAHPDDELLFLGGTIPTYAGELGMAVQVAYMVPATPYRKLELLDGLWLCGVRSYPDIGPFPDRYATSAASMYKEKEWARDRVERHVVSLYRRYRPEVAVTHDAHGEYGHGAHKVTADMAQRCIALAADEAYQSRRLEETAPWQVKKLYLHLYEQGALRMDWRVPLEAFGGKTAFDVACEAFACHTSQLHTEYRVEDFGPYDNAKFGLAFSIVGEDVQKNDFFEHIERPASL